MVRSKNLQHTLLLTSLFAAGLCAQSDQAASPLKVHRAPRPLHPKAVTEDAPWFLGPRRDAVSRETRLLKHWPQAGPLLVWELPKGSGYSSPAIVGRRLVFLHRVDDEEIVLCLDAETGQQFWRFSYRTAYRDRYGYSNGPRATPVIDDGRVYTVGAEGKVYCLSLDGGQAIWELDLVKKFGMKQGFFGFSSTPLIVDNRLIVNVGAPGGPCVVALDKKSGAPVWLAGDQWGASYASPVLATVQRQQRVFVFAGGESRPPIGGLLCIDPSTGQINFRFDWRSQSVESVNAACPVVFDDRVFVSASYKMGGALLRVTDEFDFALEWTTKELGAHFSTAIHREGYLYGIDGRHRSEAALVCLDVKTGKVQWRFAPQWQESLATATGKKQVPFGTDRGSLLWADGHFLCLGEMGHLLWLDLAPQHHKILARTWLFAAPETWSPPVLCRGLLYVVQNHRDMISGDPPRLLCYDLRGQ